MKQQFFKQLMLLICLVMAGAGTAKAYFTDRGTVDVNGVRYHLCSSNSTYYAYVEAFTDARTEVTILSQVKNGSATYNVTGLRYYNNGKTSTISSTTVIKINFEGRPNFNGEANNPTFNCPNLQIVYFNGGAPNFFGNWADIFGNSTKGKVTAYVEGTTQTQCNQLMSSNAVWGDFKQVVAFQTRCTFTLSSDLYGYGTLYVVDLGEYSSFAQSGAQNLDAKIKLRSYEYGPKSERLLRGKNYAVVCYNNDPEKIPTLKRNGTPVTVSYVTHGSTKYAYYNETNFQADVNFQWSWTSATVSGTLSSNGSGEVFVVDLGDYGSYADSNAPMLEKLLYIAKGKNVSKAAELLKGKNYAVVYVHSNLAKLPTLKRNGTEVTLNEVTHSGVKYSYYTETNLQEAVTYQWSSTDKRCTVSFTQKQPSNSYGNDYTSKTGTVNIKNGSSQQSFSTATKSYSFTQGSTMEIDIPFDGKVQTLNSIKVDGTSTAFLTENGHYKATVSVPFGNSLAVELIWNKPIPAPVVHPPMVTVMRTGEGEVMFKGMRQDSHGWEDHVMKNCSDPITTVTVPDTDYSGQSLDDDEWGICVEVKPAAGQVLRSLKVGLINYNNTANRPMMQWEEFLNNPDYSNSSYMSYDEATGTYIFDTGGDYMNFGIADYTILVDMGPETVEIENSKTFNFVRKGGEGQAFIYWDDQSCDYYFNEDGSYSVEIPNEQLTDMQMYFEIKEGETFRVFKDGEDITTQFQNNWSGDYGEYGAELETASATYTILIEKEATETTRTISFTDEVVKTICVANWDTDGDGELSYEEARNVTGPSLGEVFAGSDIEYFDEFKYFTGLTMIDDSEFSGCENLKKITLPPTVTHIGNYFFSQCRSLQNIELPSTLVAIGEDAFYESGLKEIYIPASVLTIEGLAFRGSSLELIVIDKDNPVYESGIYRSAVIEKGTQTAQTLCGNSAIPEGVSRLGNWVWTGGEGTILLVVPESVEEIGRNVFSSSLEMLMMKRREPIAFDVKYFGNASLLPANCKLIVPFGTRDAYIAAGWTEDIFKGGVVEDASILDVNGDSVINPQDALKVIEKYMDQ